MAAEIKAYSDSGCTTELAVDTENYTFRIGTVTGIDGTNGASATASIWLKNTGTILISNVSLTETLDADTRGSYSLDDSTYAATTLTIGGMAVNDVVRVYTKVTVSTGTSPGADIALNFTVAGTHL
jgi:hypothetical protein